VQIEELIDRDELRQFLMQDKLANAYLLGNLDPAYFQFCRWFGARSEEGILANVALLYTGLSLPVFFLASQEANYDRFLAACTTHLPARYHFHVLQSHTDTVTTIIQPTLMQRMIRMGLQRTSYSARTGKSDIAVHHLGHRDTAAIMKLYAHYPDNFFEPYQLETGLYFGVRDEELGLSSIVGIHVISQEHDVAVLGNFVTHPERRGSGLSTACTATLLDALFERVSLVALNVQSDNEPAIRMYNNFGFSENNIFYEGRTAR
jgi:GNAT superfamily N-acetyltransferase